MSSHPENLLSLFLRLAPIEGLPRAERRIADEVSGILRNAGIRVIEDKSGSIVHGDTGNLLCFPPSFKERTASIVLTAHLDTVQSTASLSVHVESERVSSDGRTILGADNRMGVAIL